MWEDVGGDDYVCELWYDLQIWFDDYDIQLCDMTYKYDMIMIMIYKCCIAEEVGGDDYDNDRGQHCHFVKVASFVAGNLS